MNVEARRIWKHVRIVVLNQSTLTGEAMPLQKVAAAHAGTAETPFDLPNICFMGSAVVRGIGCVAVVLTGPRTACGTRFTWLMLGFIHVMAPLVFDVTISERLTLLSEPPLAGAG